MDPMISILLPTRKRTHMLQTSLTSVLALARRPQEIETLIAYDDDDDESHEFFSGSIWQDFMSAWPTSHRLFRVPRWGYGALHHYVNMLALASQGRWIMFWNDDSIMETQHWDDHVRDNQDFMGLLHITASNMPMNCSIFPLLNREWLDLFGCVSPINHADSWVSDVCWNAAARRVIPVTAFHDRFETSGRNQDETWHDKRHALANGSNADYHTPENRDLRREWSVRLRDYRQNSPSKRPDPVPGRK